VPEETVVELPFKGVVGVMKEEINIYRREGSPFILIQSSQQFVGRGDSHIGDGAYRVKQTTFNAFSVGSLMLISFLIGRRSKK